MRNTPQYLILRAYPNAYSNLIPGKVWDGNNGQLYTEKDLCLLIRNFGECVSTRRTKYGLSYYFPNLTAYSREATWCVS